MSHDASPRLGKESFACPHCGANSQQDWYFLKAHKSQRDEDTFLDTNSRHVNEIYERAKSAIGNLYGDELAAATNFMRRIEGIRLAKPFFMQLEDNYLRYHGVENMHISRCYSCKQLSIWVFKEVVYPGSRIARLPNEDLPNDVASDFVEASLIWHNSPRGAAALLRLCIQKLCIHVGGEGKSIDADISRLVKDGLDERLVKMLDVVRVVGNESVHPGEMSIGDTPEVVETLFDLVNEICDQMISKPKRLDAIYSTLPAEKLKGIEVRNARALAGPKED